MSESQILTHTLLFDKNVPNAELIPYLVVNGLIALSNIIINSFLLYSLNKLKKTSTISFMFVRCLSASDMIVGLGQIVYLICRSMIGSFTQETLSAVNYTVQTIFYVTSPFSGGMILIIAADRYIHMKYLTKYNVIMTRNRALSLIFANFIFQLTTAVSLLLASMNGYFPIQQPILVCAYLVMFGAAVSLYHKAFRSIRRRTRNSSVSIEQFSTTLTATTAVDRRCPSYDFSKTMMYILVSLVVCYMPFLVLTTTRSVMVLCHVDLTHCLMYALLWTYNLNFLLSTLNPIIFIAFNKDLRSYAKQSMYKKINRRHSSQLEEFPMSRLETTAVEANVRRLTVVSLPR